MASLTLDQAEESVEQARSELQNTAEKLERKVLGDVDELTSVARDTTQSIKDLVHETTNQVLGVFDVTPHVRANPLASVATAMAAGFTVGMLSKTSASSPLSQLWSTLQRELVTIGETTIVQMSAKWRDNVQTFTQELIRPTPGVATNPPRPYRS